jgi:hypothetical protein
MSLRGQSRHFDRAPLTSGLPQLADILRVIRQVSKVPKDDIARPLEMKEAANMRRPYFLLAGLRKEARKIGYNILNPLILLFLRGSIDFDAVVEYFRASRRRNFLGKN